MKRITEILKPVGRASGGQRLHHCKDTAEKETVRFLPKEVVLPLSMHIGAPCKPLVEKGERVLVGQLIADSDSPVSAPIHASVSGTVTKIEPITLANGRAVDAIFIESDGMMEEIEHQPPQVESLDDFLKAVRASGLVGLGGAGFPVAVKLNFGDKPIDTLVINAAECEPYITADYRECMEFSGSILEGVNALTKWLDIPNVIICIEDNKPLAIDVLAKVAATDDRVGDRVKLMKLPSSYPQGAEKMLVWSATGRAIPVGGLPADVGCVVMNITSVSFIGKYLESGMPLVSKRVTVSGSAVSEPKNVLIPIGTRMQELLDFCGGFKETVRKVIAGGPMMGAAVHDLSLPIVKAGNALLAFGEKEATLPEPSACIRCGRCVTTCPMHLMPLQVERALAADDTARLVKLSVLSCMECGCCSYGCPAKRPLVQSMRIAKQKVRG